MVLLTMLNTQKLPLVIERKKNTQTVKMKINGNFSISSAIMCRMDMKGAKTKGGRPIKSHFKKNNLRVQTFR